MPATEPCETQYKATSEQDFFCRHVTMNEYLGARRTEYATTICSEDDRSEIARRRGVTLGTLLRSMNDTAPLGEPVRYRNKTNDFEVVPMLGLCDDYAGERFAKFGEAVTLRFYLKNCPELPQRLFEAADWNFMDAGMPGYVGYAIGSTDGDTLYVSGIQSDLAARYSYLMQSRQPTEIRNGDEISIGRGPVEGLGAVSTIRTLRRVFQRDWLAILLRGIAAFMKTRKLRKFALHQFPFLPEESEPGHQMWRVYRALPRRVGASALRVRTEDADYRYALFDLRHLDKYLGVASHAQKD
ncbi:hypothetical protein [Parerythrobacter aestuarii]|uniref:hypothetical protein n=1 Tax=Parerythrobacter aestuarii TaxID=3020909 RepID=UPI0024DE0A50|nr:hypothetical protein [Parerythrobacter aestuarii]